MAITGPAIAARRRAVNDPLFKEIADRTLQLVPAVAEPRTRAARRPARCHQDRRFGNLRRSGDPQPDQRLRHASTALASAADAFFDGVPDQELVKGVRSALVDSDQAPKATRRRSNSAERLMT